LNRILAVYSPDEYGQGDDEVEELLKKRAFELRVDIDIFKSNRVGEIADYIIGIAEETMGIIINPAEITTDLLMLRDTLLKTRLPVITVYTDNIYCQQEEGLSNFSAMAAVSTGLISGMGLDSYQYALDAVENILKKGSF